VAKNTYSRNDQEGLVNMMRIVLSRLDKLEGHTSMLLEVE